MANKIIDTFNHVTGRKGFDYSQITNEIFLGTNACCQYGFSHELLLKGIKADISLEKDKIDSPVGVDYFLWLPTGDHKAPSMEKLDLGVRALDFFVSNKIKVYIHCKNGHGRAPTLLAAYLVKTGMALDDAINFMGQKRPSIHLNNAQITIIKEFQNKFL